MAFYAAETAIQIGKDIFCRIGDCSHRAWSALSKRCFQGKLANGSCIRAINALNALLLFY